MVEFTTLQFADISTAHLRETDLELLKTAPNHLAELDCHRGDFFYVPCDGSLEDFKTLAKEHGMSAEFIAILEQLHSQEIPYVRFDGDAVETPGLPIPDGKHFEIEVIEVRHVRTKYIVEANDKIDAREKATAGDTIFEEDLKSEVSERMVCAVEASAATAPVLGE